MDVVIFLVRLLAIFTGMALFAFGVEQIFILIRKSQHKKDRGD